MVSVREIDLYAHQSASVEALRAGMRSGSRCIVLVAPTAFGKTECAAYIIQKGMAKGARVWFIVDRVNLIDQTSDRFAQYGIDHGIIQAKHPLTAPDKPVQIASVQTLANRSFSYLPDLIIVDEAHCQYKTVLDLMERAVDAKVIGLTATPFSPGMAERWNGIVNGATVNQLLQPDENGKTFLTPLKIKACITPEMKDVKRTKFGEYDDEEAGERGITIIGNVVQTWIEQTLKHFGRPVKTLVFSPSVKHGDELRRQFSEAGYNFQQISYLDASDDARREKIAEFRKPDSAIDGLISCAVLTKGFDVPDVLCGISCRPYRKSFSSHIQELGRVMRVADDKTFGLWLDHSGNCIAFAEDTAWLYEYGVDSLSSAAKKDSEVREPKEKTKKDFFCAECGSQMPPRADTCEDCGWVRPARGEHRVIQGELVDFEAKLGTSGAFRPRQGLRADCLSDPRRMWNAAVCYCLTNGARGDMAARKWGYGVWCGIYPQSRLPHGLFEAPADPTNIKSDEWALIEREVRRYRKSGKSGRKAA